MPYGREVERAVRCPRCGAALAESAYASHRCADMDGRLASLLVCLLALAAVMAFIAASILLPHLAKG